MTLPRFLIIGAPRCGTTFLAQNLQLHPDIFFPSKEVELGSGDLHFFDRHTEKGRANFEKGLAWYEDLFSECASHQLPGEKTADYLGSEESAELIFKTLGPQTKMIALVRDPVLRAHSHYLHSRHRLPIGLSFSRMVELLEDPEGLPVLTSGLYFSQLQPYLRLFGADNVLVVVNEDLEEDPQGELARISRFLGIHDRFSFELADARINQSSTGWVAHYSARIGRWLNRNAPSLYAWILNGGISSLTKALILRLRGKPLKQENSSAKKTTMVAERDRERLKGYYRSDVEQLSALLHRDLSRLWWGQ